MWWRALQTGRFEDLANAETWAEVSGGKALYVVGAPVKTGEE
jgi:hypothetical protein